MSGYYLTPKQFGVLVKRLVWITVGKPSKEYIAWWEKQNQRELENKLGLISEDQASTLIENTGNWEKILSYLQEWGIKAV